MAEKPKLYYFNGRGRMEQIRWLLAAAGVEWERAWILERIMLVKNPNSHIVDSLHTSSCFLRILNSKLEMADLQNTLK